MPTDMHAQPVTFSVDPPDHPLNRMTGSAFARVTDRHPPFSLR